MSSSPAAPDPEGWSGPAADDPLLADIVEHLVPEAFATATCAERVALEPVRLGQERPGRAAARFERWVDDRLLEALERAAYEPAVGVVVVSDGTLLRRYVDCGCGDVTCAAVAAAVELWKVTAPWVFAADLARPAPRWTEVHDGDGRTEAELLVPPEVPWAAPWFAEARGHGVADQRAGALAMVGEVVVDGRTLDPARCGLPRSVVELLRGHPSRRRNPRRRRRPPAPGPPTSGW